MRACPPGQAVEVGEIASSKRSMETGIELQGKEN